MYSHCIRRQNNLPKLERLCVLRKGLGTVAERKLNMKTNTKKIAGVGLLTAVVVVLPLLGSFIHFGPFSISLVLIIGCVARSCIWNYCFNFRQCCGFFSR